MDREKLFQHFEKHYIARRDMISRLPLGIDPEKLWQEVLDRRKARAVTLPLLSPSGSPYWYMTTDRMVAASEKIIEEFLDNETEIDPYRETPPLSSLEEVYFTSYVEGAQISMQEAMAFLQSGQEPRDVREQMILNNRRAMSFASANLYQGIDGMFLQNLAYFLTENMENGGPEFRTQDTVAIPSMQNEPFVLPSSFSLPDRIREFSAFLADPSVHPLIKAGNAQAWVLLTRPFNEGNERLARLLSSVILLRAGYSFFGEISLSALIARRNYDYYTAIANILRKENGNDLTYFLDYFLSLLSRAVDERHLRKEQMSRKAAEDERAMARMPLVADPVSPIGSQGGPPHETEEIVVEMQDFSLISIPEESIDNEEVLSMTGETILQEGGEASPRKQTKGLMAALTAMASAEDSMQGKTAQALLNYLSSGKYTFTCAEVCADIGISMEYAAKMAFRFRTKGLIEAVGKEGRMAVYGFIVDKTERYDGSDNSKRAMQELGYSSALLETVDALANSVHSPKDRRIAEVLQDCLPRGVITRQDYENAGIKSRWSVDTNLAEQLGLIEKTDPDTFRILKDLRQGPPTLKPAQKEAATVMYETFGEELFSLEMVIATLDYSSSHASAMLHQFTLLKVLDCKREEIYRYQFLINPEMYPECFSAAA